MSIDRADRLVALLGELTREDYGALPPAERRRVIEALEKAHRIARTEETIANARDATAGDSVEIGGIVAQLARGERAP